MGLDQNIAQNMGYIRKLLHVVEEGVMPRLPNTPFERPMPDPDDLEESGQSSDHSALQGHIKLGAAWLCATLAGVIAVLTVLAVIWVTRSFRSATV